LHTSLHAHSANANSDSLRYLLHWPLLLQGNTKFFGIVDTGATSLLLPEAMYLSNVQESHESVSWGNNSSSRATGVGSLYGTTAGSIQPGGDGVLVPMLVTSGQLDSYALPDIDQILFSVPVWNAQGHTCDFGLYAAGLTIKTRIGKVRIPFVRQQSTIYCLMRLYPPPPYASLYVTTIGEQDPEISESLPVINLTTSKISSNLVQVVKGLNPSIVGSDSDSESSAASDVSNTSSSSSAESLVLAGNLVKKRAGLKRRKSSDQGKLRVVKKIVFHRKIRARRQLPKEIKAKRVMMILMLPRH